MNQVLNTRAAKGLPLSAKNRRRKTRIPFKCRLGFHHWEIIDDAPMDAVPTTYPPERKVDYVSPKRQCVCCLKVEWFVGPEVCGGKVPRWVDPPSIALGYPVGGNPFPEFSCMLRELKPGEFTIVSFSRISIPKEGHESLRAKQVLIRKKP